MASIHEVGSSRGNIYRGAQESQGQQGYQGSVRSVGSQNSQRLSGDQAHPAPEIPRPPSAAQENSVPIADRNVAPPPPNAPGHQELEHAKQCFTKLRSQQIANEVLRINPDFVQAIEQDMSSTEVIINNLQAVALPADALVGLNVTIMFPNQPVVTLIPVDADKLRGLAPAEIRSYYLAVNAGMRSWQQNNQANDQTLAQAQQELAQAEATLKQVREQLERADRERTGAPGNCPLEMLYGQFKEKGVTINEVAEEVRELHDSTPIAVHG